MRSRGPSTPRGPTNAPSAGGCDGWLAVAVALVVGVAQWPLHDRWLGLLDEGYVLGIADRINHGAVLYRDVIVDAPLPGAFHLLAWWFRVAGTSVAASRWLAVAGFAGYVAATFCIARRVLSRWWALGLVPLLLCYRIWAFPHWQTYSYSLVAALLATIAAALVASTAGRLAPGRVALAGLAAGGAIMCKQDYGVALAGTLGVALLALPHLGAGAGRRSAGALGPAAWFVGGIVLVVVPPLVWFWWQGALGPMVQQTLLFPLHVMSRFSYTRLPSLRPLFAQDPAFRAEIGSYFPAILVTLWWSACPGCWVSDLSRGWLYNDTAFWDVSLKLVYWAPLALVAAAGLLWAGAVVRDRRRARADAAPRLVLLAWAAGFLLAFSRPRDWVHLMMIYPPSLVVGAVLLRDGIARIPAPLARLARLGTGAALLLALLVSAALATDLRRQIAWPLDLPRAGVYADPHNGPIIQDVLAYVEREVPPDEPLPVFPTQPMLGFLAGRAPAAGYSVIWPFQSAERDAAIIADLEARHVSHVIYAVSHYAHLGSFQTNAPRLYAYLVDHYEIDRVFSREAFGPIVLALRRRPAATDTVHLRDLVDASPPLGWARWPFAEVLTQPITRPGAPRPASVAVEVPPMRPVLRLAAGVNPDRWLGLTRGPFTFRVALDPGPGGEARVLAERVLNPGLVPTDRRWAPIEIDLTPWAGRRVTLSLSIEAGGSGEDVDDVAGWREPVFVAAAARSPAPR
jgi:hypothetical protein